MEEEAITSGDQLVVIEQWLSYMRTVEKTESWSLAEIAEVNAVFNIVKVNEY